MCAAVGFVFLVQRQRTTQRLPRPFVSAALAIAGHSMPHYSGAERRDDDDVVCSFAAAGKSRSGRADGKKPQYRPHKRSITLHHRQRGCASFCANYLNYGLWLSCHG